MKTATKKTTSVHSSTKKKASMPEKKRRISKTSSYMEDDRTDDVDTFGETPVVNSTPASAPVNRVAIVALFLIALVGFGAYKYQHLLTPARVNGQPIYVWDYLWKLHTQYGRDQLNSMATELMISQAVASSKVDTPASEIDSEIKAIEQEASSSGGLKAVLEAQRMSLDEFKNRIRLQLAVKKILADKIKVTDQEVDDAYKKNKDFYKGMSEAQAKESVKKQLEDQKFQTEVQTWLSDVKSKAKIEVKFPGIQ